MLHTSIQGFKVTPTKEEQKHLAKNVVKLLIMSKHTIFCCVCVQVFLKPCLISHLSLIMLLLQLYTLMALQTFIASMTQGKIREKCVKCHEIHLSERHQTMDWWMRLWARFSRTMSWFFAIFLGVSFCVVCVCVCCTKEINYNS